MMFKWDQPYAVGSGGESGREDQTFNMHLLTNKDTLGTAVCGEAGHTGVPSGGPEAFCERWGATSWSEI